MRYIHDIIVGGVDGTLSSFSFLAMLKSADFPKQYILIILILKLLSDGVSLSLSNYSGRASDNEVREALQEKEDIDPLTPSLNPYTAGLSTLIGFLVFGSIPILIYHYVLHDIANIYISALVIITVLFCMGLLKSLVIHNNAIRGLKGGIEFSAVGLVGIVAAVSIGLTIKHFAGHKYHGA